MPHIRLEYSSNLEIVNSFDDVFEKIHLVLHETAGIKIENCKSRAICLTDFYIGSGREENAFIHLELSVLEGRTTEVKKLIRERVLHALRQFIQGSNENHELQITVEVRDITRAMYAKHPRASLRY